MKTCLLLSFFIISALNLKAQTTTVLDSVCMAPNRSGSQTVTLYWTKGHEEVDYFMVERSLDGGFRYTNCGMVFTSEDASFVQYRFKDKAIAAGKVVYRIVCVDKKSVATNTRALPLLYKEAPIAK